MFFDLLKREITNDVAVAPETKMRDEQKAQYMSSDPIQSWWYNILMMEQIPFALESVVVPGTEDQWPEGKRFKAPVAYGHFEEWNNKSGPKGMGPGSHKFYNRLIHDYGAQKTKINGVNYLRFGSLEYHKAKLIDRVGFDIFAIHNSEERDDEN